MLIISKHKDYYDGVVGTMGVDKSIVYERNTVELDDKKQYPKHFRGVNSRWNEKNKLIQHFSYRSVGEKYLNATHFIVGFCGKLYLGFKMEYENPHKRYHNDNLIEFSYDVKEFKTHFNPTWSFADFDEFVEYVNNFDCVDVHRELNTPIFIYDTNIFTYNNKFIINPILKNYQFYKVFDTFTAFQEIQMYISGVLGVGENPTIEVSDKDKIISRGFDYKWSFRKEPKEKK